MTTKTVRFPPTRWTDPGETTAHEVLVLDTDPNLTADSATRVPSQSAVKRALEGITWKNAVDVATTAAGTLASSFEGGDTVDSVTLSPGDRILIKNQAAGAENGIYIVQSSGAPVRADDADEGNKLKGCVTSVRKGTANADTVWTCTNDTITLGTTALVFARIPSGSMAGQTLYVNEAVVTEPSVALDDAEPAADTGFVNVAWQRSAAAQTEHISAQVEQQYATSPMFGRVQIVDPIASTNLGAEFGGTYTLASYPWGTKRTRTLMDVWVNATTLSSPGPGTWTLNVYKGATKVGTFTFTLGAGGAYSVTSGTWSVEGGQNLTFASTDKMNVTASGSNTNSISVWVVIGWRFE